MIIWRKSSHSGSIHETECVEVAELPSRIGVRDSKNPYGPVLVLDRRDFRTFLAQVKTLDDHRPDISVSAS
jgi:hypothetical protein